MFTQWRHAVENLAQAPRTSQDASNTAETPARASTDSSVRPSISSSSQLAESALSTLRKSLVSQRPASPSQNSGQTKSPAAAHPTPTPAPEPPPAGSTTVDDSLRPNFPRWHPSATSTPSTSPRASPSPVPAADHPLAHIDPSTSLSAPFSDYQRPHVPSRRYGEHLVHSETLGYPESGCFAEYDT